MEVDGKREVTVWGEPKSNAECRKMEGTDGILISPFRKKDEGLTFFARQLCATVHMDYKRMASFRGINVHVFEFKFEDLVTNVTCFCRDSIECPPKGTMNLFPCVQVYDFKRCTYRIYGERLMKCALDDSVAQCTRLANYE